LIIFLKCLSDIYAAALLFRTARRDASHLTIGPPHLCLLAALSFPRLAASASAWFVSLLAAALCPAFLLTAAGIYRRLKGRILIGGGDIKMIFACLLLFPAERLPLFLTLLLLYTGWLYFVWPDKRRLPLGAAIASAALICLMLR